MPRRRKRLGRGGARNRGSNLTDNDRAEILVQKDLRRSKGLTNKKIAENLKISSWAVDHTHQYNVNDKVLELYEKKKERLASRALDVTYAALEKGEELINQADDPRQLAGVAAMGKFADQVHRLETGQPTQINATIGTDSHALEFIKLLMEQMDRAAALEAFKQASLEPLVPDSRKLDIIHRIETGELRLLTA